MASDTATAVDVSDELSALKERRPNLSERSYSTYHQSLRRLKKVSSTYDLDTLTTYLEALKNPPLARNLLTPLLVLHPERYRALFDRLQRAADEIRVNQLPSRSQQVNVTTMKEVHRMLRRMREDVRTHKLLQRNFFDDLNIVQRRLVIAYVSYTILLDVTMRNDLPTLQFAKTTAETTEKGNWYVHSTGTIVLRKFKTSRSFQRRGMLPLRIGLSRSTRSLVNRFVQSRQFQEGRLLSLTREKPLTKLAHAAILTANSYRYLGVRLGTTMLRHLVLSEFEKRNPSLKERKDKMRRMQQLRIETQMSYAWRGEGLSGEVKK